MMMLLLSLSGEKFKKKRFQMIDNSLRLLRQRVRLATVWTKGVFSRVFLALCRHEFRVRELTLGRRASSLEFNRCHCAAPS